MTVGPYGTDWVGWDEKGWGGVGLYEAVLVGGWPLAVREKHLAEGVVEIARLSVPGQLGVLRPAHIVQV